MAQIENNINIIVPALANEIKIIPRDIIRQGFTWYTTTGLFVGVSAWGWGTDARVGRCSTFTNKIAYYRTQCSVKFVNVFTNIQKIRIVLEEIYSMLYDEDTLTHQNNYIPSSADMQRMRLFRHNYNFVDQPEVATAYNRHYSYDDTINFIDSLVSYTNKKAVYELKSSVFSLFENKPIGSYSDFLLKLDELFPCSFNVLSWGIYFEIETL